jgi:hypothetical protein
LVPVEANDSGAGFRRFRNPVNVELVQFEPEYFVGSPADAAPTAL